MKNIINTSSWARDAHGWSIAPAGLPWIKEGFKIIGGEGVTIGEGVTVGV